MDCEWKIIAPTGKVLQLKVEYFQLGGNGLLEIFDFCPYGHRVQSLSGTVEPSLVITTTANEAFLKFTANGLQSTHGFNISYQAILPPHLQQNNQGNTRERRAIAGVLTGFASFVKILFTVWNVIDGHQADQQQQQLTDTLNLLENKIDGIHEKIQEQGVMNVFRHKKELDAQRFAASEQRINNMRDTFFTRLWIIDNGTLEPGNLAQEWTQTVLSQDSEGMNQAQNNMRNMVVGSPTVFGGTSLLETLDAELRRVKDPNSLEKLKTISEYTMNLQVSGYFLWILALKQKNDMDQADEVMKRALNKLSEQRCFIARFFYEWPTGTYGLPKASSGCPAGFREGQYEFRGHDSSFSWGNEAHFAGSLSNSTVKQGVCMKTTSSGNEGNWPKGSYCIFKYGNCPVGFSPGLLGFPGGTQTGVVPDGSVSSDSTEVEYCCRDDGFASYPIRLPSRPPFYLLRRDRREGECQQVDGATVSEEWLEYRGNGYRDGMTPDDDGDDNSHKLYSCVYTRNTPNTVISSDARPGDNGNYDDLPDTTVIPDSAAIQVPTAIGFVVCAISFVAALCRALL
ncbi:PREDICTED: uncharacterized protein LOC109471388 [Branchiostoma belcheri]|uniref:Uncharacterized protein LOC109471388 n=1 Tax=Branchiostoma belcheri TaxID=7741 RepID=A0A6P4YAY0_BRABE|nr:PREDICTED: uncharacterized protein LOC109471388 [Branchiostoma belcheri]